MKNILFLFISLCLGLLIVGCEDEDRIRIPEPQSGVNMRIVLDPAHSDINNAGDTIIADLYSENDDLSLVEIFLHYQNQRHLVATYTQADFNDGVQRLQITSQDLATFFGVPGFGNATAGGDFFLRPRVTLNDGRVYPDFVKISDTDSILNLAPSVQTAQNGAFTVAMPFSIICPPLELDGEFDAVTTGQSVWAGTPCNSVFTGRVRWTTQTPGIYLTETLINGVWLDDTSMGGYTACYGATTDPGLPNGAGGIAGTLRLRENCGVLSFQGASQWGEAYTINNLIVNGNQLTIDWVNSYGESAITVLTRTDGQNWPSHLSF